MSSHPIETVSAPVSAATQASLPQPQPVRSAKIPAKDDAAHTAAATETPAQDAVQSAVLQIQKYLSDSGRTINFQIDAASGLSVVTVRDAETGDVIRQIPNEETLRLAQLLKEGNGLVGYTTLMLTA